MLASLGSESAHIYRTDQPCLVQRPLCGEAVVQPNTELGTVSAASVRARRKVVQYSHAIFFTRRTTQAAIIQVGNTDAPLLVEPLLLPAFDLQSRGEGEHSGTVSIS